MTVMDESGPSAEHRETPRVSVRVSDFAPCCGCVASSFCPLSLDPVNNLPGAAAVGSGAAASAALPLTLAEHRDIAPGCGCVAFVSRISLPALHSDALGYRRWAASFCPLSFDPVNNWPGAAAVGAFFHFYAAAEGRVDCAVAACHLHLSASYAYPPRVAALHV